jgi:hypothetical protein
MGASRREFLKATAIAGAGVAMARLSALAEPMSAQAEGNSPEAGRVLDAAGKQEYTRGIGIYPGARSEDFSPELVPDTGYRNLARLRPAYHSSSYDYNLTAQLVTDGIKDTRPPEWIGISHGLHGPLPREDREYIVDHSPMSALEVRGPRLSVDIHLGGGDSVPEVDSIQLFAVPPSQIRAASLRFSVSVSPDGRTWQEYGSVAAPTPASTAGFPPDFAAPGRFFTPVIPLQSVSSARYYRVECRGDDIPADPENAETMMWRLSEVAFFLGNQRVQIGGPYRFTSAWMSAGLGQEWVYVDLGARFDFDRLKLYWIARAAEGSIQVSDDA